MICQWAPPPSSQLILSSSPTTLLLKEFMSRHVAVISYAFRFPGTSNEHFWEDLLAGRNLVTEVQAERWAQESFLHPKKNHPGTSYTFAAGSIGDVSGFDAHFFGISPREAALMDPQQRLLLEMSWEALENGGIRPSTLRGSRCGVFIGIASADYSYRIADDLDIIDASVATGNTASIAANRLSYVFDLCGPSMAIDTACSSALVAFHQACSSILSGESDQALTGGVSLHLHPYGFLTFSKASMLSPRGKCSVFDAAADGYVRSEGGGIFFLKNYAQALADGDPILAVVAASAVNTDGRKTGLTVPSPRRQAELLRQVYHQAGIAPSSLAYLEAHGTGTAVGDPVEAQAIGDSLGCQRAADSPLPIGSIKSNLGHLEAASGVAGLVKAIHCLQHRIIPATIGLETINPTIDLAALNIEIVTEPRSLDTQSELTVGVNSFGFGGANAHVILQTPAGQSQSASLVAPPAMIPLLFSTRTYEALPHLAAAYAQLLEAHPDSLPQVAANAVQRRDLLPQRAVVWGRESGATSAALQSFARGEAAPRILTGTALEAPSGVAFVYSGNGSQWVGMGQRLLVDPLFHQSLAEIDAVFQPLAGFSLIDELAGSNGEDRYVLTEIAQPALFAVQVGLTRMLRRGGLMPAAVAGHSVGEVAAAWTAGVLDLASAVKVIYHRSRLQGTTKGRGQMTVVGLGANEIHELLCSLGLEQVVALAGVNSYRGSTLAGDPPALAVAEAELTRQGLFYRRLDLDYAFHSPAMDSIEAGISAALADVIPSQGAIPFYSTVTGQKIDGTALNAAYWWHNIRKPVLFQSAIMDMQSSGINIFLEVGPHAVLRSYLNDCLKESGHQGRVIGTLKRDDNDPQRIWESCSQAMIAGAPVDWATLFPNLSPFLPLPNYPWQRERYWHSQTPEGHSTLERCKVHPLLGYRLRHQELTWENQLDTLLLPTLADHVVGEATVFPGTGYAELALAAAHAWLDGEVIEIEDLEIRSPLILEGEHSQTLRVKIDERDGSTTMVSRGQGTDDPWTTHGVCRILREPGHLPLQVECPALPLRQADFTGASHLRLTQTVGLSYGPSFQCITHGWITDQSVLAVLSLPQFLAEENRQMLLHPSLLDCAFQLIIQLMRERVELHDGTTFIPVRMGRISLHTRTGTPTLVQVRLLRQTPQSLSADFVLFDNEQQVVAVIKEARFRRIRLHKGASERLQLLTEHWEPMPLPGAQAQRPVLPALQVHELLNDVARRVSLSGAHRRFTQEVDPLLEVLCTQWMVEAFQQLADADQLLGRLQVESWSANRPELQPFIRHLIEMGLEEQCLVETAEGWKVIYCEQDQASATDIWNSLVADYPDSFHLVHAVGRIGMHLADLLCGRRAPVEVLPRSNSIASLICQALGGEGKQKIGQALRQLVTRGIRQLPAGERLRVIEIGRFMPSYADDLLAVMEPRCCDLVFVATGAELQDELPVLQERYPLLDIRTLPETGLSGAALPVGQMVVLTLDFSTLAEANAALQYARTSLIPGGSLVVVGFHPSRWVDFLFGGQAAHWNFAGDGRHRSQQCSAQLWIQQVQQHQFGQVSLLELSPDTLSGPFLLLAQPAENHRLPVQGRAHPGPRSWILLADAFGPSARLADELARRLQTKGDMVVVARAGDVTQLEQLIRETTAQYGQLDGIVHLAGLTGPQEIASAEAEVQRQAIRCTVAAHLLQACESNALQTTCWLVSCGLGDQANLVHTEAQLPCCDASLWGFGRTMMNESSNLHIRLVALEHPLATEAIDALVREFDRENKEQEVRLSAQGKRFVPRLAVEPRHLPETHQNPKDKGYTRLGFSFAGKLRNLRWQMYPAVQLAADEVEIEVRATGLNFRDLMFTLGLLSEEALENGFAGPSLGLEFSGIVRAVGNPESPFAEGDKVVGFGPSCFADRVVTTTSAITLLPPGLSFAAASTIPCTFFTVYYALRYLAQLEPGERVLIHCAAGGVGIAAVQVAKWIGAEIFVTAGSSEKRDFLRLLGVDHIFDSRTLAYADEIMAVTSGQGVDVVLNSLAGEAIGRNFRILRPFGRFLELGKRDFYENTKIGLRPFRNNISYFGIDTDQLMLTRPELTRRLFAEVMELFSEGILHPLPYLTFEAEEIIDAFRTMQRARHIGKIVVTYRNGIRHTEAAKPGHRSRLSLPEDCTYLVTGGLGGFGLRTAQWLVERGARHLALISRSGPAAEEAQHALEQLHKQGVQVLARSCDVTDHGALRVLLEEMAATMPPLKGIVHAATVIEDGLIRTMDGEQIRHVLRPKVLGAYHLHQLTQAMELDLFVLFSSATTLFGNPGQGNYVAANAALEALAKQRRAAGLAATCVRWGAIEDVGFLARHANIRDALQGRMGGATLQSAAALDILEELLVADRSGLGVMEIDWRALSRFLPSATSPKFSELARSAGKVQAADGDGDAFHRLMESLSAEELQQACIDMLKREVAEILRMAPERLDSARSMYDMGLDSLMGVELMGALESRFSIRLPVLIISQHPTIAKLAEYIIGQLKDGEQRKKDPNAQHALAQVQQVSQQHGSAANAVVLEEVAQDLQEAQHGTTSMIIQ